MGRIFVSHASADDAFVAELGRRLEERGHPTWVDARRLHSGDRLGPEIETAIADAPHVIVVLGPATVNSPWVRREVRAALAVQHERADGYRVIPLLLPGVTVGALGLWFPDEEPVAVEVGEGGLVAAMPALLAALGDRRATGAEEFRQAPAGAVDELVLRLSGPRIRTRDGVRRAWATAQLIHEPAEPGRESVESRPFAFTAPLGPIEVADLRWYLESYYLWPVGVFRDRAAGIEAKLPQWGQELLAAARCDGVAFDSWEQAGREGALRRFSVLVDDAPPVDAATDDADAETQAATTEAALEAAADLLALPWELLHDDSTWLFQGDNAVRVRRRLPNRRPRSERRTNLPIRILLVSPRPEQSEAGDPVGYLDHRASALPLVEAVENLGELARLTVLQPPTYAALERALRDGDQGQPFDVVHFDGHGIYDRRRGLGGLCFEQPREGRGERVLDLVHADRLAELVRYHRIPLVFLEACQTALTESDPTASVAATLLDEGVASVVAMTHSVLVETARRFVQAFYRTLAEGARVGTAMVEGQRALFDDPCRGKIPGAGELRLRDWFVPVLYQEKLDPQPITHLAGPDVQRLEQQGRTLRLGELPAPPEHHFQGRSRELLALERHLHDARWAVVRGTGGQGKTTLAVELARWLVRTHRAQRAVFVNLEHHRDPRAVLDTIGRQLVPKYSVAEYPTLDAGRQPVDQALADEAVVLVVDNCESVLPDPSLDAVEPSADAVTPDEADDTSAAILALCRQLLDADPRTRLVFTTREPLPSPFADRDHEWELGALPRNDAVELVMQVMTQHGWIPPATDAGATPEEITELVEAVHGHPRALVLLAREIAERGVRATTDDLRDLMADLDRKHPGERENSLYASVELSLRRLSPEARRHVEALACCHGGVHLGVMAELTRLDIDATLRLGGQLIAVGLGEDMGHGHLRLDPGLAPYLRTVLATADVDALEVRWAEAVNRLTYYLSSEELQDVHHSRQLTVLELPNLLALLDWLPDHQPPENVAQLAARVEMLLQYSGQLQAIARTVRIRRQASEELVGWNRAGSDSAKAEIHRLLDLGELPAALIAAQRLLDQHLAMGETAYPGADYDTASSFWRLGLVLVSGRAAQAALTPLGEAQHRFQKLADAGDDGAASMAAKAVQLSGDCFQMLGRLDKAVDAYRDGIRRATVLGDRRQAAVTEGQLATVRLLQKYYQEALDGYAKARATFEAMNEPRSVATSWHQIGRVHQETGQVDDAEDAYRRSLAIQVREGNLPGQAASLSQLGNLYGQQNRLEESVTFTRQAAEICMRSEDRANEGVIRSNLALALLNLRRHGEARQELQRALTCKRDYGHSAQPWKTWMILADLESTTGHPEAALIARRETVATYLAYRRDGGRSESHLIDIFTAAARAIDNDQSDKLGRELDSLLEPDDPPWFAASIRAVRAILAGQRDPALTDDPEIDPISAAELLFLLDTPAEQNPTNPPG